MLFLLVCYIYCVPFETPKAFVFSPMLPCPYSLPFVGFPGDSCTQDWLDSAQGGASVAVGSLPGKFALPASELFVFNTKFPCQNNPSKGDFCTLDLNVQIINKKAEV